MKDQKQKPMSPKSFLISFFALSLALLLLMGAAVYLLDPFAYYRYEEGQLIVNNYRFVNPGIAKNVDYDAVVVGSSMTQNFDLPLMREKLGVDPVKLTVGGMSVEGMELTLDLVKREGKAKTVFVCLDLPTFNKEKDDLSTYATYLYDEDALNDVKYLCGYETWMRLLPLNLGFRALDAAGKKIPNSQATRDLDTIGEWHSSATYSAENLKKTYYKTLEDLEEETESEQEILARMKKNADKTLALFAEETELEFVLFFPPYSQLFWNGATLTDHLSPYLAAKEYVAARVAEYDHLTLYDFQSMAESADLDNYKDYTHYSKDLNDRMVECFATGDFLVDEVTIRDANAALVARLEEFQEENASWLKNPGSST
ncbi:MAG: hypothetical protein II328_05005 [Clostridia bacterium]|nr:hypothetical protein [Clostridia bacterium]